MWGPRTLQSLCGRHPIPPNVEVDGYDDGGSSTCSVLNDRIECAFDGPMPAGGNGENLSFRFRLTSFSDDGKLVSSTTAFAAESDIDPSNNTVLASALEADLNLAPYESAGLADQVSLFTEGNAASFSVSSGFSDDDGDELAYEASRIEIPASHSNNGTISGTPTDGEAGNSFSVTITATDPFGSTADSGFEITVEEAAEPPPPPPPHPRHRAIRAAAAAGLSASSHSQHWDCTCWAGEGSRRPGTPLRSSRTPDSPGQRAGRIAFQPIARAIMELGRD